MTPTRPTPELRCHVCGGRMHDARSDMPFKLDRRLIVGIRDLPVLQCESCGDYTVHDDVMAKIEATLARPAGATDVEVVAFAA